MGFSISLLRQSLSSNVVNLRNSMAMLHANRGYPLQAPNLDIKDVISEIKAHFGMQSLANSNWHFSRPLLLFHFRVKVVVDLHFSSNLGRRRSRSHIQFGPETKRECPNNMCQMVQSRVGQGFQASWASSCTSTNKANATSAMASNASGWIKCSSLVWNYTYEQKRMHSQTRRHKQHIFIIKPVWEI